jgi:alpha-L-fucosidase
MGMYFRDHCQHADNKEALTMSDPAVHGPTPSRSQVAWHRSPVYGFIHFTVNTFTDREWGYGDEPESVFAPTALDCRQWVDAAKAGGLTYLILTAKHHDGFCLWPTATTTHNIRRSPFRDGRGDLVREFVEACREGGIGCGLYCSPWDRNHPEYARPAYTAVYHAQWRELLTNYGPLCELWFDGANGGDGYYGGVREKRSIDVSTYYRFAELWAMCRLYQPEALLFSDAGPDLRWCGNENGYASATCWAKVAGAADAFPGKVPMPAMITGDPDGAVWRPAEVDVSIRPGWFWHRNEVPRTGENLFRLWLTSVGRGCGLNLNLPPDRRGLIPAQDLSELRRFRSMVENFTAHDLAAGRQVTTSATMAGEGSHLVDRDPDTWWAAADRCAEVAIKLGSHERLGGIRIEEAICFGQRVESFAVDVRTGGHWFEHAVGTTIGGQRVLELLPCIGDAVRVRILVSQAPPVLSRIQVFAG